MLKFRLAQALPLIGLLLLSAASGFGQNYGSQFYKSIDFPGTDWPDEPRPATAVSIGNPTGIAVDAAGNVYIAGPSIIFKVDPAGMLTRIAGTGYNGYSGDGGPAAQAELGFPLATPYDFIDWGDAVGGIAIDPSGNLYIADMFNNRIRKVTPDGVISTVAGNGNDAGFHPYDNNEFLTKDAPLWLPTGVAVDSAGFIYIADGRTVWQATPDGLIHSLARNDCGRHEEPGVCAPGGLTVDDTGDVFVSDGYCRVRKISPDGTITNAAGDGRPGGSFTFTCGYSGDNGPAVLAALGTPYGVAVDSAGNLYVADTYNNRIRKVSPDGTMLTIAGNGSPAASYGAPFPGGYSGDGGPAVGSQLKLPHAVAVDPAGNIYIADTGNYVVRKITPDGIITTIAGNGSWCCSR